MATIIVGHLRDYANPSHLLFGGSAFVVFQFLSGYLVIQSSLCLRASIQVQLTLTGWSEFIWALFAEFRAPPSYLSMIFSDKLHSWINYFIGVNILKLFKCCKYQVEIYTVQSKCFLEVRQQKASEPFLQYQFHSISGAQLLWTSITLL